MRRNKNDRRFIPRSNKKTRREAKKSNKNDARREAIEEQQQNSIDAPSRCSEKNVNNTRREAT